MQKGFILLFYIFFGISTSAQIGPVIGRNNNNEERVAKGEISSQFSTLKLAHAITKNATTDRQKVISIYTWIAANIAYDHELRLSKMLQNTIYTSENNVIKKVLERNKALCGGYAFLFKNLCIDVGVSAEVIHGFTRDYSRKSRKSKTPNHTWNAVKLDGQWQLLDITWAISYGNKNGTDDFWFLTEPSDFIYTHYPEISKWTLLKHQVSFSDFQAHLVK
ncbi:transglutaminase domain-containing protein [Aequorivita flava]|uniref:Transglutaminase domain-containing protein n=1 Tax=Aequorivita flava TaxID=3114371 RepID=A0AB35YP95_9FLAO